MCVPHFGVNMKVRHIDTKEKTGLVLVFTGNGKGKTTAALGTVLRASGYNMKICIIQFIKGDIYSGEIDGIKKLGQDIELHVMGKGFYINEDNLSIYNEHREKAQAAISLAREKLLSGKFDILVLDEVNNAVNLKLVDISQVIELIDIKPPLMHMILTGREAHTDIIKRANIVTEMKEIKHSYHQNIEPQKGIDY